MMVDQILLCFRSQRVCWATRGGCWMNTSLNNARSASAPMVLNPTNWLIILCPKRHEALTNRGVDACVVSFEEFTLWEGRIYPWCRLQESMVDTRCVLCVEIFLASWNNLSSSQYILSWLSFLAILLCSRSQRVCWATRGRCWLTLPSPDVIFIENHEHQDKTSL